MSQNYRFAMAVQILEVLGAQPETMHTSAAIAASLKCNPVMVRRAFLSLQKAGLIQQRKGPKGGAKLKLTAKQIGLGDIFRAVEGETLFHIPADRGDKTLAAVLKKAQTEIVECLNETTLNQVLKKARKQIDKTDKAA